MVCVSWFPPKFLNTDGADVAGHLTVGQLAQYAGRKLVRSMQRKLTVILSADVVGYSALMERDEAGTLARLKANRSGVFDPRAVAHGGRIFKLMGDGVLIEFASAVAAVACALEIQQVMDAPEHAPLRYRIGINLGDVIVEGDDIYGDGVNVAARLQALAPVGGIALARN